MTKNESRRKDLAKAINKIKGLRELLEKKKKEGPIINKNGFKLVKKPPIEIKK